MIIEALLNSINFTLQFLLGILPNIPGFGDTLLDSLDYFVSLVTGVIGLISYLFSPVLVIFSFTAILILLNFDNVYKAVLWFIHKVRG